MRGPVPTLVLVILSLCAVCLPLGAQDAAEPGRVGLELQTDPDFAEEIKQIEAAPDTEARYAAFGAVLKKATELEQPPAPLVSILNNKRPEDTFTDLLTYIRDRESARHRAFLRPLVLVAHDAGDAAEIAVACVKSFGAESIEPICEMIAGEEGETRLAAAHIAGERPGGAAGAVRMIPKLVNALGPADSDFTGIAMRSLRRITLLEYERAESWRGWLGDKTAHELLIEIADREAAARRDAELAKERAESDLLRVLLERMDAEESEDVPTLVGKLREAEYLAVRLKAVSLLKALLPTRDEESSATIIDAVGEMLLDDDQPGELRLACAKALADSGKPVLAFPYIDSALQANGISADLRLELVKGLNSPVAAGRLAALLKHEVAGVETRSGVVLEQLISQVRSVVEIRDTSEAKDAILAELGRLLRIVADSIQGDDLGAPARERLVDLAIDTCDTLVHIARLRQVDVSACVDSLVTLASGENGAAAAALTALRQALNVASSRSELIKRMTAPPITDELTVLYQRLIADEGGSRSRLVNLMGLYGDMGVAPEPIEKLRSRLIERANESEAVLPPNPEVRKTVRDALRALLAALLETPDEHIELVSDLLQAEHGLNDALGYLQVLAPPRVPVLAGAMQPLLNRKPLELGRLVASLEDSLTGDEKNDDAYREFRSGLDRAVRAKLRGVVSKALRDGLDDETTELLTATGSGTLRGSFVPVAVEELKARPDKSEARDTISEILMSSLRRAHPERYDGIVLKEHERKEFLEQLDVLNTLLRDDGYVLP